MRRELKPQLLNPEHHKLTVISGENEQVICCHAIMIVPVAVDRFTVQIFEVIDGRMVQVGGIANVTKVEKVYP